jgi:hypothetical protein
MKLTTQELSDAALELLIELESSRLEVVLIPAPEQRHSCHSVRAVQESNAEWYQKMCKRHLRRRKRYSKPDTLINRAHTIKALERVMEGRIDSLYAERLMPFIKEKAQEMRGGRFDSYSEQRVESASCSPVGG